MYFVNKWIRENLKPYQSAQLIHWCFINKGRVEAGIKDKFTAGETVYPGQIVQIKSDGKIYGANI